MVSINVNLLHKLTSGQKMYTFFTGIELIFFIFLSIKHLN